MAMATPGPRTCAAAPIGPAGECCGGPVVHSENRRASGASVSVQNPSYSGANHRTVTVSGARRPGAGWAVNAAGPERQRCILAQGSLSTTVKADRPFRRDGVASRPHRRRSWGDTFKVRAPHTALRCSDEDGYPLGQRASLTAGGETARRQRARPPTEPRGVRSPRPGLERPSTPTGTIHASTVTGSENVAITLLGKGPDVVPLVLPQWPGVVFCPGLKYSP